jgi:hypothetical protein
MDTKKVELSANAFSYEIEIDVRDLEVNESLEARYKRYFSERQTRDKNKRIVERVESITLPT